MENTVYHRHKGYEDRPKSKNCRDGIQPHEPISITHPALNYYLVPSTLGRYCHGDLGSERYINFAPSSTTFISVRSLCLGSTPGRRGLVGSRSPVPRCGAAWVTEPSRRVADRAPALSLFALSLHNTSLHLQGMAYLTQSNIQLGTAAALQLFTGFDSLP